jgi:3-phenylpropionate/trans-cinnamate dioxygenase ferredoxin subunit
VSGSQPQPPVRAGDVAEGTALRVVVDGVPVCLTRCQGQLHAVGDVCTHQDISLSEGEVDVDECTIECWKHGSAFSLTTGEPLSLPATRPVPVYEVLVDGDEVRIVVDPDGAPT